MSTAIILTSNQMRLNSGVLAGLFGFIGGTESTLHDHEIERQKTIGRPDEVVRLGV